MKHLHLPWNWSKLIGAQIKEFSDINKSGQLHSFIRLIMIETVYSLINVDIKLTSAVKTIQKKEYKCS